MLPNIYAKQLKMTIYIVKGKRNMKHVPAKIFIICLIVGLVIIVGMGCLQIGQIKAMDIENRNYQAESLNITQQLVIQIGMITIAASALYLIIATIIFIFVIKVAIPYMVKSRRYLVEKTRSEEVDIKKLLLHMTDGIIAFDMKGRIILINPAATRLLRLMPEDENFEKIFKKLNIEVNMEKIIYLENWTSQEQRIRIGDTSVNIFFAPVKNENNRPAGVMVVIQDITEHVKLDDMRKEFVADVSHELKTPITSIMGYADTLLEGEYERDMQNKFLNVIASEARRMAKLVTDLLTLSRYDNNQMNVEKTEFDLGELVKRCQEKVLPQYEKKEQQVECFVTANVPPVYADKDGIERVVLNILTNSIKYTKEKGNIKIYVGFVYSDAYIKIIDNGIGIPEEDLNKIFERFYRVDKARTREMGGTGLRTFYCKRNTR